MSGLDYVRWRFWDRERYTEAQVAQLRRLRALHTAQSYSQMLCMD